MKKKENRHHVTPRSRLHCSKRTVGFPKGFHRSLHEFFGNLWGDEMVLFVKELNKMMEERSEIRGEDLEELRNDIKGLGLHDYRR